MDHDFNDYLIIMSFLKQARENKEEKMEERKSEKNR